MPHIQLAYRLPLIIPDWQRPWISMLKARPHIGTPDRRLDAPVRLYMNGVAQTAQCGLVERLAQRRVNVDGASHVFKHCAHFQCMGELSGQFRHMTSYSVNTEYAMIVLAGDDANKATIVAAFHAERAAVGREREDAADCFDPRCFRLIRKHAGGNDFWFGKGVIPK